MSLDQHEAARDVGDAMRRRTNGAPPTDTAIQSGPRATSCQSPPAISKGLWLRIATDLRAAR
jgi:hypothetical protein